jgi:hypothetical protein
MALPFFLWAEALEIEERSFVAAFLGMTARWIRESSLLSRSDILRGLICLARLERMPG